MGKLEKNLVEIKQTINNPPKCESFSSNAEFMEFVIKLMNYCLYLLKTGALMAPSELISNRGYTKHHAVIVGHLVRIAKLYEGFIIHVVNQQHELAMMFIRPIHETATRMAYIINSKNRSKSIKSFILGSYRPEKDMLKDLYKKKDVRKLSPIEKRIFASIKSRAQKDNISISSIISNKRWGVDGKSFRDITSALGLDHQYIYMYANSSHYLHGDWHDIYHHHLEKKGRFYFPNLQYSITDPRATGSLTIICLQTLIAFILWNKSDIDEIVLPVIQGLLELTIQVDLAHELTLNKK